MFIVGQKEILLVSVSDFLSFEEMYTRAMRQDEYSTDAFVYVHSQRNLIHLNIVEYSFCSYIDSCKQISGLGRELSLNVNR